MQPFPGFYCDECGKPAMSIARDMRVVVNEASPEDKVYEVVGEPRFGCMTHPVERRIFFADSATLLEPSTEDSAKGLAGGSTE